MQKQNKKTERENMRTRAQWEWDCLYGKGMEEPKKETTEEEETETGQQ